MSIQIVYNTNFEHIGIISLKKKDLKQLQKYGKVIIRGKDLVYYPIDLYLPSGHAVRHKVLICETINAHD